MRSIVFTSLMMVCLIGCKRSANVSDSSKGDVVDIENNYDEEKESLAESVGTQAYLFGTSLMTQIYFRNKMLKMVEVSKNTNSPLKFNEAASDGLHFNELIHTLNLTNHSMKIGGTPNVDTRYSIIFFDLTQGPQVLKVPRINDRYFSINITDAYLGNKPYICSRKGDTDGGTYLFTGPDHKQDVPSGMKEIKMPQNNFLVVVRIYVKDRTTDNEEVTKIQNEFVFESLEKYTGKVQSDKLIPVSNVPMKSGIEYFEQMVATMQSNPPEEYQSLIWHLMGQVGVSRDQPFKTDDLVEPVRSGLVKGIEKGKEIINWRNKQRSGKTTSNWYYSLSMGVDHEDYMHRSEWAVQGLTVGSPEEAIFFNAFEDGSKIKLDGSKTYTITIPADRMPPVNEFWSITSYGEGFDVVPNEEFHYGVGSRNKDDMVYNSDGSLTFKVQSEKPVDGLWNWIPTPEEGPFKLCFRFYNPKEVMLNAETIDDYLPPIEEVKLRN